MKSPVGIFDSGLGGLTVAARVLDILPEEQIIYFADNAHVPYGERPLEEIQGFALGITEFLISKGAKTVVMACNMSSAVALDLAREAYPDVPILGVIEPGARAAARVADGKPVGVLATTGTVKSGAYVREILTADPGCSVVQQACPQFVPIVESGKSDSEEAEAAACTYVAPILREGCGTIILGCTHYPFLRRAISSAAGYGVKIIDPAEETAHTLEKTLAENGIGSSGPASEHIYYASGDLHDFEALGSEFLGKPLGEVLHAEWGTDLQTQLERVRAQAS